jgi:tetratricopeptide (TPR) repeat protein
MSISLCMIVKNEEDWIEGALESVRSAVDEIIIADTGCTDSTIRRAARFSPKVVNFQWTDSFAEARNRTLAEARHPWVLVLDADERIAARDLPLLADAINKGCDGFHLTQRNYVFGNQVFGWTPNAGDYPEGDPYAGYVDNPLIRLFRNSPELRFRGAVHEIIDPTRLPAHLRFGSLPIAIHHYGKVRGRERVAAKQRMYLQLGLKKANEDPTNAKAWFDLGIQHQELNQHDEAAECFKKTYALSNLPVALLYRAISEKQRGSRVEALALLETALNSGLDTFDVRLELGNIQLALGRLDKALQEYRICLRLRPDNPVATFNCGLAYRKLGDVQSAETYYWKAVQLDVTFDIAALELATLLDAQSRYVEAAGLLQSVIERDPDCRPARLTLAKIHIQTCRSEAALALLQNASPDDAIAQSLAGAAYLQADNLNEAEQRLERALKLDRTLIDARINLAHLYERKGDRGRAERFRASAAMALK